MDLLNKIKKVCVANEDCVTCPLKGNGSLCILHNDIPVFWNAEEIDKIVNHWLELHGPKTRQSEMLKIVPDVPIADDGVILICPSDVHVQNSCYGKKCSECRREFWLKEIE